MNISAIKTSPEVAAAIAAGKPVVALESTIISHGMPYPQNVETALAVEGIIRALDVIPASIAIIGGIPTVGLSQDEIEYLAKKGSSVAKASRRDLPVLVAQGRDGATTVASTMIFANLAGISVFATGGIGGVHRGAGVTMDISADLEELSQTPVLVVCAGVKSILDIGLTLEYLETRGVPILGYQTDELPAFFSRKSGFKVDYRMDSTVDIAKAFKSQRELGLISGMVLANPIEERYSMNEEIINAAIFSALLEAEKRNIRGKDITPFLLKTVNDLTGGDSLNSNIHLIANNARIAAMIALDYCNL